MTTQTEALDEAEKALAQLQKKVVWDKDRFPPIEDRVNELAALEAELEQRAKLQRQSRIQVETDLQIWQKFLVLWHDLKQAKGDERSERARRLSVVITDIEKVLSTYKVMVLDNLE